jgi:hypothetical protein
MVVIENKEYPDNGLFKENFIQKYCNLKIYPIIGILEKEIGLLSDFAEELNASIIQYGNSDLETYQYVESLINNKKIF